MDATNERQNSELEKIHAQISDTMAATARIRREPLWHPIAIALGLLLAGTALGAGWIVLAKILA
jgi:hypothetical protein